METGMVGPLSDQQLTQLVVPLLGKQPLRFTLIRQGLANRVYKADGQSSSWAIKLLGPADFSAVNYASVYAIQQQLSAYQLAPSLVGFDADKRLWIEQWVATETQDETEVTLLAKALATIHQTEINAPTLALLPCWQHYLEQLPLKQNRLLAKERDALIPVISRFSQYKDFCFCHNDLSYAHLVGPTRDKIIDWEYAAIGNRYFDIAACIQINALTLQQCDILCDVYANLVGLPVAKVMAGAAAFAPVVDFTNRLWSAAAAVNGLNV